MPDFKAAATQLVSIPAADSRLCFCRHLHCRPSWDWAGAGSAEVVCGGGRERCNAAGRPAGAEPACSGAQSARQVRVLPAASTLSSGDNHGRHVHLAAAPTPAAGQPLTGRLRRPACRLWQPVFEMVSTKLDVLRVFRGHGRGLRRQPRRTRRRGQAALRPPWSGPPSRCRRSRRMACPSRWVVSCSCDVAVDGQPLAWTAPRV